MKPPKAIKSFYLFIFFFSIIFSIFLSTFLASNSYSQQDPYFRIYENGKFGYIDSTGKVLIEPKFLNAGDFYDGLAPARLNGTFGYIDITGNFVIAPIYDYAEEFRDGIARVYVDAESFFIDRNGMKYESNYKSIENSKYGLKEVRTYSGKYGLMNEEGIFVLDTIYKSISGFSLPVASFQLERTDNPRNLIGVIDSTGKIIIPLGEYDNISTRENLIYAVKEDINKVDSYLLDFSGKKIIAVSYIDSNFPGNEYIDLNEAEVKSGFIAAIKRSKSIDEYRTEFVLLDMNGDMVFNDSKYIDGVLLNKNRMLLLDKDYRNWLVSLDGKLITEKPFGNYRGNEYIEVPEDGKILIMGGAIGDKWGIMDLDGNFILPPYYEELYYCSTKDIVVTQMINGFYNPMNYYHSSRLYGVATVDGKELIKPKFERISQSFEIRNGIFPVIEHDLLGYVNIKGEYVWRQQKENERSDTLNTDIQKEINFVVYTQNPPDQNGRENLFYNKRGWGNSYYVTEKISEDVVKKEKKIDFYIKEEFKDRKKSIALYLVNDTDKEVEIGTQDNQLFISLEVQDEKGNWRTINSIQPSWCGNSYYSILFPAESYCKFNLPQFKGTYHTKLRARLLNNKSFFSYSKKDKDFIKLDKELVSNEIYCSINPAQLWREEERFGMLGLVDLMTLY